MPALSKEQVRKWVDDFLLATSGKWAKDRLEDAPRPTDWKKLEELFSKRAEVFFVLDSGGRARCARVRRGACEDQALLSGAGRCDTELGPWRAHSFGAMHMTVARAGCHTLVYSRSSVNDVCMHNAGGNAGRAKDEEIRGLAEKGDGVLQQLQERQGGRVTHFHIPASPCAHAPQQRHFQNHHLNH